MLHVSWVVPGRSYTRGFAKYALNLRQKMTVRDVADLLGVSEWLVRDIEKRWLGKHFAKPKLKHLKHIAIDEIATKKGHVYVTLVMDLESGAVVFVGKGKGASALKPFWKRLKSSGAKINALAMDMSKAYIQAASENLPDVPIVFDWFHVVKLFNDKLSQLRRELYHEATNKLHKQVLKGTRWLLLKRPENLDPKKKELRRLKDALKLNESLATAYYLKEDLRELWHQPTKAAARTFLDQWIADAMGTGIKVLQTLATTLQTYREGLLAWFDHPISTGPLEGTNNKIKTLKRQAYGFRDQEYFALKILALHNANWRLIG
jgi:transposase